jgi:maltose O-acetyltransferase
MFGPERHHRDSDASLLAEERNPQQFPDGFYNIEYGKPITIGSGVWLAAGVIVCGGVHIGDDVVIAAGAVVTTRYPLPLFSRGGPLQSPSSPQ